MSTLRPECRPGTHKMIPDETVLFLMKKAIDRRKGLIHGKLHGPGGHCALGCYWTDHPGTAISTKLVEEIAAVNDSLPNGTPKERWKMVQSWLRMKLAVLAKRAK